MPRHSCAALPLSRRASERSAGANATDLEQPRQVRVHRTSDRTLATKPVRLGWICFQLADNCRFWILRALYRRLQHQV